MPASDQDTIEGIRPETDVIFFTTRNPSAVGWKSGITGQREMPLFNGPLGHHHNYRVAVLCNEDNAQRERDPCADHRASKPLAFRRPLFLGPQAVNAESTMHYQMPVAFVCLCVNALDNPGF